MSSEAPSLRNKGVSFAVCGVLVTGLNWYCAYQTRTFFPLAAVLGPIIIAYGLSIIVRPPQQWPQKQFELIHTIILTAGVLLGLLHYALLKYGSLKNLFQTLSHAGN